MGNRDGMLLHELPEIAHVGVAQAVLYGQALKFGIAFEGLSQAVSAWLLMMLSGCRNS